MPPIDTIARQKWPAPNPPPDPKEAKAELAEALEEVKANPLRAKTRAVQALLRQEYGEPTWPFLEPLSSLIEILLSHRTTDPQAWSAFTELQRRFPTWEALRDAPVEEIEEAVHGTTWPEQKAARIKSVLQKITAERGDLDISFLLDIPLEEANAWLQSLGGVGPKSAACVLLFSCHRPVLPVDTHLHRVSIRLGLIDKKLSADAAHPILQSLLPDPDDAKEVLAFHRNMLLHGQQVCVFHDPKCYKCVVRDWCDYFASHPEKQAEAKAKSKAQ